MEQNIHVIRGDVAWIIECFIPDDDGSDRFTRIEDRLEKIEGILEEIRGKLSAT